ncbi:hypothetical protein [Xenorhabdus cabanillasii]|uniref:Uncharacterized protein n=1 Tax=Xenorhabdus cabanillasii JM26 TaxID=1427517 RepID=W1INM9_9GAMM|nr:hypothetical protein [Xenorhabdus cabanillasii]PHM76937.1 hypothetical protein Xcab_02504 [Xenorhabdus cabanillasii JM26]CDL80097.1 conserved hypothetical protein [Xenorhabdus cabanillasii JM26]
MSRDQILERILYSHYLEQVYSTATGRVDKFISVLMFIFGSTIVFNGNPYVFGFLIVALTAIQTNFQFALKSGLAKKKAADYLKLHTLESKYDDQALMDKLLELEGSDEILWSSLQNIAVLKTQIKLEVQPDLQEKLTLSGKLTKLVFA